MLLSQITHTSGSQCVVAREGDNARIVNGADSILALAKRAIARDMALAELIAEQGLGDSVDLDAAYAEGRVLAPITPMIPRACISPAPGSPISVRPRPATPCTSKPAPKKTSPIP